MWVEATIMLLFDSAAPVSTPRGGSRRPVFYSVFAHGDDSADSAGAPGDAMVMSHPRPAGTQKHVFLDGDSVRGRGGSRTGFMASPRSSRRQIPARQQARSAELGWANPFVRGVWPPDTDPCNQRCEGTVRVCPTASEERRARMRQSFRPRGVASRHRSL